MSLIFTSNIRLNLEPVPFSVHDGIEEADMDVTTYSEARANLKSLMDRVVEDHDPVVIARRRGQSVVMMSLEDWNSLQTTTQLLSSPENAARLRRSIAQLDAGKGVERELIRP